MFTTAHSRKQFLEQMTLKYYYDLETLEAKPLYYYSLNTFLVFKNCWKIILRHQITPKEFEIMNLLKIYKPSRSELGLRKTKK